jgi:hypothetical protein
MRRSVRSMPTSQTVMSIGGETDPPVTATRIGWIKGHPLIWGAVFRIRRERRDHPSNNRPGKQYV